MRVGEKGVARLSRLAGLGDFVSSRPTPMQAGTSLVCVLAGLCGLRVSGFRRYRQPCDLRSRASYLLFANTARSSASEIDIL